MTTTTAEKEATHDARQIASVGEPMLTIRDLCERYRCHRTTIWYRVRRGELPPPVMAGPNSPRWHPQTIREHQASLPTADYAPDSEAASA